MRPFEQHFGRLMMLAAVLLPLLAAACGASASPQAQSEPPQSRIDAASGGAAADHLRADDGPHPYDAPGPRPTPAASATAVAPPASSVDHRAASSGPLNAGTAGDASAAVAGDPSVAIAASTISIPANETVIPLATATPAPTATALPDGSPTIGGCPVFPADNAWNQDISAAPIDVDSATYITNIGGGNLHADFGGSGAYGIPYIIVPQSQPLVPINFTAYGDESDPGPYPIPLTAPIEGGGGSTGDRHVLTIQQGTCKLYEMFSAYPGTGAWDAASGTVFDLRSNALRPDTWISADAAGLPIAAGLVRYDEVAAGQINHAVRFTVNTVRKAWVHPATHYGTSTSTTRIPYGAKLRLKASYDISSFSGEARVILTALKKYGMIVADQGTSWYITGDGDPRWDDNDLNQLKTVPGSMFEVVQLGQIYTYP